MMDMLDFLAKLKNDIESYKVEDFCQFRGIRPSVGAYNNALYQKIYTYRFFRAYFLEYIQLTDLFYNDYLLPNDIKEINVLSLGSGVGVDYYAMTEVFKGIAFTYTGIDINLWEVPFLPNKANNYVFKCKSVSDLESKDLNCINTLFIPKSISNWFDSGVLESLVDKISQNNIMTLYILFSSENYTAESYYKMFDNLLTNAGYSYQASYKNNKNLFHWYSLYNCWESEGSGRKFSSLYYLDFIYNVQHLKCASISNDCENCEVTMSPPYTNSLMDFNYFVYQKLVTR